MSKEFRLQSKFQPAGDQPAAIRGLISGLESGLAHQTLLGVTGSGKTFTMANVVQQLQRPTIVMAPNKTLAAQLYGEFKSFSPITLLSTSSPTTTTTSPKPMCPRQIRLLRRMPQSMTILSRCVFPLRKRYWSAVMR